MPYHAAADERRCNVPDCSNDNSPQLSACEARPARGCIIETGPHTTGVGQHLSHGNENTKCDCVLKTQNPVESGAESKPPDRAEYGLPRQWVMIVRATCSMKFNRDGNAGCGSGSDSKEKAETDTVADSEHDRVRHHPGEQPQGTVLAAQQIVSKIKGAEHVQTDAGEADGCDSVVVNRNHYGNMIRAGSG